MLEKKKSKPIARGSARKSPLAPSFVVILTTAAAAGLALGQTACSDLLDATGLAPAEPTPQPQPEPCGAGCTNPPPPQPIPPPKPDFGATVSHPNAAPLGAASMIVTTHGAAKAVMTDPDRDRAVIVDLATKAVHEVPFEAGAEPARLVEDADSSHVHVVLRRAGAVATIDLATSAIVATRAVCSAPQGVARLADTLFVTCAGGELVSLPAKTDGQPTTLATLDRDLRDIVVNADGTLILSRLRSAEILTVRKDGSLIARSTPLEATSPADPTAFAGWRLAPGDASAGRQALFVHQAASNEVVNVETPHAYSGTMPCAGFIRTRIASISASPTNAPTIAEGPAIGDAVAAVDVASSPNGDWIALIAAGNGHTRELPQVHLIASSELPAISTVTSKINPPVTAGDCVAQPQSINPFASMSKDPVGQAVAVAFTPANQLVVFTREPAALHINTASKLEPSVYAWYTIALGGGSVEDTGHAVFHSNTGGRIACVSCHPEAGDDGRVWTFSNTGARRTQTLLGTIKDTAPYHWGGDAPSMHTFAETVFNQRMGGQVLRGDQVGALQGWLEATKTPPVDVPSDTAAIVRGKQLFESSAVGCASCHSGPKLTNNQTVDVGTGGAFQVPSLLGVSAHAPFLHDGCAKTLLDRFGSCGGGDKHGHTSGLTEAEKKDLATYLESL